MEVANEKIGRCIHKCIYIKKGRNNHNYHSLCFWNWSDDHDLYYNYVFPLAILSIFAFRKHIGYSWLFDCGVNPNIHS